MGLGGTFMHCFNKAHEIGKETHAKAESCWTDSCIAKIWDNAANRMGQIALEMQMDQQRIIDERTRRMTQSWAEDERRERQNAIVKRIPDINYGLNNRGYDAERLQREADTENRRRQAEIERKNSQAGDRLIDQYAPSACSGKGNGYADCYALIEHIVNRAVAICNSNGQYTCNKEWNDMLANIQGRANYNEREHETPLGNITPRRSSGGSSGGINAHVPKGVTHWD
ncbi:MAG: hypothetical protein ACHQUC_07680 [Chlamydiales bacterium]